MEYVLLTLKFLRLAIDMTVHLLTLEQIHALNFGHVRFRVVAIADVNEVVVDRIASVVVVIPNIDLQMCQRDNQHCIICANESDEMINVVSTHLPIVQSGPHPDDLVLQLDVRS